VARGFSGRLLELTDRALDLLDRLREKSAGTVSNEWLADQERAEGTAGWDGPRWRSASELEEIRKRSEQAESEPSV
jgi:hypothetical protein